MAILLKRRASLVTSCRDAGELPLITLDLIESGGGRLMCDEVPVGPRPDAGAALVASGDVLFGKLRPYLAKSLLVSEPAYASTELLAIRPADQLDARFLAYVVQSRPFVEWNVATSEGTKMPRTSWEKAGSYAIAERTIHAQRLVADFLDTETARIDALIAKKRLLARTMLEREEVHIEETLCMHGGVELPLRRLLTEPPVYGAAETGVEGPDHWPRYIRITDLDDEGELRSDQVLRLPPEIARPYLLREGDLLLARSGATVGKAYLHGGSDGPAAFAGYLIRFRADSKRLLPELLRAWTSTSHYWWQVRLASLQATIENVSAEKYKDFSVPVPPRNKQPAIVATIHERLARSKSVRDRLRRQLLLLQEHRQALITAAVTGELEVPGAAA